MRPIIARPAVKVCNRKNRQETNHILQKSLRTDEKKKKQMLTVSRPSDSMNGTLPSPTQKKSKELIVNYL
jgi:hypothetical protein